MKVNLLNKVNKLNQCDNFKKSQEFCSDFTSPGANSISKNKLISIKNIKNIPMQHFSGIKIFDTSYSPLSVVDVSQTDIKQQLMQNISEFYKQDRQFIDSVYFEEQDKKNYSSFAYIQKILSDNSEITEYFQSQNLRLIKQKYEEFYKNNLLSLEDVAKDKRTYTNSFLDKKIGDKPLIDLWLSLLNQDPKQKKDKIDLLNQSIKDYYAQYGDIDMLYLNTILAYFSHEIHNPSDFVPNYSDKNCNVDGFRQLCDNVSNTQDYHLADLEDIKNKIEEISQIQDSSLQEQEFFKFIQSSDIDFKINNIKISDMFLLPIEAMGIDITDFSEDTKRDYLQEIAKDTTLRKQSLAQTLSLIRKQWFYEKSQQEKRTNAKRFVEENKDRIDNFNRELVEKIYLQEGNKKTEAIIGELNKFENELSRAFSLAIVHQLHFSQTPINEKTMDGINIIFSLCYERLNRIKDNNEVQQIHDYIGILSDMLYTPTLEPKEQLNENEIKAINAIWTKLTAIAKKEWMEVHYKQIVEQQQNHYVSVGEYLLGTKSKQIENTNIIDTFFSSTTVPIHQKAYLANIAQSDIGYDLCKFLSDYVPTNIARQRVLENMTDSEQTSIEIYNDIKESFISATVDNDYQNPVFVNKINNISLLDLVLSKLDGNNESEFNNIEQKVKKINEYPLEDLLSVLDDVKKIYIKEQTAKAFQYEANKYDMASQFDRLFKDVEVEIDGKKYSIIDIVENRSFELETLIEKFHKADIAQLNKMFAHLQNNTSKINEMYVAMGVLLDRIQNSNPRYAAQCKQAKSLLQKLVQCSLNPLVAGAGFDTVYGILNKKGVGRIARSLIVVASSLLRSVIL